MRLEHWFCAGEPSSRRSGIPIVPADDASPIEFSAWYIDSAQASVTALWADGVLWLGGAACHAIGADARPLRLVTQGPPHLPPAPTPFWARVTPERGKRYVATTDPDAVPDPDRTLARSALAQALGERGGAALVLDAVASVTPANLAQYIASLRTWGVDLSWQGNEGGPGLLHSFTRARRPGERVRDVLLAQARHDEVLAGCIADAAHAWLEDQTDRIPDAGLLIAGRPERGYWHPVSLDELAGGVRGSAGAWLDPGTQHARLGYLQRLPGARVVLALRTLVDEPTIISLSSGPDPEQAVVTCHLVGGVDRRSGDVTGFVLERIWT